MANHVINDERAALIESAQTFVDMATNYLLEIVPEGRNWEDERPDIDTARSLVMDLIETLKKEA